MTIKDYDIVGSYDNQRYTPINAERTINMFEFIDPQGKKPKVLLSTSGLVDADLDFDDETGGARATFVFNNEIFNVFGQTVFGTQGPSDFLETLPIGKLSTSIGYVGVDANTFQVIFVDGVQGWIWDINTETFKLITDPAFPSRPIDVCYIDGFFIVANGETNQFQMSSFNNGLIWGADSAGTGNSFVAASGASPNLVLTSGSTLFYQVGTPITFNGGGTLPTGTPAISTGVTYYVVAVISPTIFRISITQGEHL